MTRSICPNVECPDKKYYEVGLSCPTCGTMIMKLGFMETVRTMNRKDDFASERGRSGSGETS
jgi:hypothetical protein